MKRVWFLILGSGGVLFLGLGGCGWSGVVVAKKILNYQLSVNSLDFKIFKTCAGRIPVMRDVEKLLDDKTYIVLLQNNYELRATGGFMGSFARVKLKKQGLDKLEVEDIYVPDGQLPGHVEPPYPVQEAFRQGWWRLRDSNWDVDFASAAATVAWFLEQGGEKGIDGVVGVNMTLVAKWLDILGGVHVPTVDQMVNDKNLYPLAQRNAEENWFEGSAQKRDFLGEVGRAMVGKFRLGGPLKLIRAAGLVKSELDRGQILVWMRDEDEQKKWEDMGWAGRLRREEGEDYLYIVEANLSANKANCCIRREVRQEMGGGEVKLGIKWWNENPSWRAMRPTFWGGNYYDYVRVIIPSEAEIGKVAVGGRELRRARGEDFLLPTSLRQNYSDDMYVVEKRGGVQIIGFWAVVEAKEAVTAEIEYKRVERGGYKIRVMRQPGIEGMPYKLVYNGREVVNRVIDGEVVISGR